MKNLKGFLTGFIISSCLFGMCVPTIAATTRQVTGIYSGASIYLDGKKVVAEPIEISGTSYLPLRTIGEALSLNVDWNDMTKTITLESTESFANGNSTAISGKNVGQKAKGVYSDASIYLNGKKVIAEPIEVNGTTYLPLRTIGEALSLNVDWHGSTKTISLSTEGNSANAVAGSNKNGVSYEVTYQKCTTQKNAYSDKLRYYAIVEIKNTGKTDLYLKDAVFDFEDKNGHLLETDSFISSNPNIIAPGEKGYFYNNLGGEFDTIKENTEFVFKPKLAVEKSKNKIIRYEISDAAKTVSDDNLIITGRVKNTTQKDDSLVWIFFVLYRNDGTPITAGGTNIMDLAAGETASFSRTFYNYELTGVNPSEVAGIEIIVEKMQYQF